MPKRVEVSQLAGPEYNTERKYKSSNEDVDWEGYYLIYTKQDNVE